MNCGSSQMQELFVNPYDRSQHVYPYPPDLWLVTQGLWVVWVCVGMGTGRLKSMVCNCQRLSEIVPASHGPLVKHICSS